MAESLCRGPGRRDSVEPLRDRAIRGYGEGHSKVVGEEIMGNKYRDTKTQRHKERPHQRILSAAFLCVSVSLCLCVYSLTAQAQLFPKGRTNTGPKPKNIHGVVFDLR